MWQNIHIISGIGSDILLLSFLHFDEFDEFSGISSDVPDMTSFTNIILLTG